MLATFQDGAKYVRLLMGPPRVPVWQPMIVDKDSKLPPPAATAAAGSSQAATGRDAHERYCEQRLTQFVPYRCRDDLKRGLPTFAAAFEAWLCVSCALN